MNHVDPPVTTHESGIAGQKVERSGDGVIERQTVIILVGLPGSAKSTLSNALVRASSDRSWQAPRGPSACSEDRTGTTHDGGTIVAPTADESPSRRRQECEAAMRDALERGENVIVDRVNFDPTQRRHFVDIASSHQPRPQIFALVLNVSPDELLRRIGLRSDHPTIPDLQTGERVLGQMRAIWAPPSRDIPEGFDRILTLAEDDQPANGVWTSESLNELLERIEKEGEGEVGERRGVVSLTRGFGYRGGRGGWDRGGRGGQGEWRGGRGGWNGGRGGWNGERGRGGAGGYDGAGGWRGGRGGGGRPFNPLGPPGGAMGLDPLNPQSWRPILLPQAPISRGDSPDARIGSEGWHNDGASSRQQSVDGAPSTTNQGGLMGADGLQRPPPPEAVRHYDARVP